MTSSGTQPHETRFAAAAFQAPDAFYWPGYLWVWNDDLAPAAITASRTLWRNSGSVREASSGENSTSRL